ncbi:MAG: hypothetical protein IJZ06_09635 [Bacteroidales bacterium]|nr:hypothetical protein [Bacteroidales bacterium]
MSVTNKTKIYSELESAVYGGYVTDVSQVRGAVKLQAGTEDNGKVLKVVNGEYKNEFVVDDEIKKEFALSLQTGNNIISVPLNSTFLSGEKSFLYKFKEALGDKCNNIRCLYNNGSEIVQQTLIYDASTNTWSGDLDNIYPEYYYIVNMKESLYLSFVVQYLNPTLIGLSNPNRFLRLYKGNNYFGNPLQKDISLLDLPKYLKFRSGEPCEGDTIFIVSSQSNATYFIVYTNGSWSGHDEILNAYSHGIRYYRAGEDVAMLLWEQDDWGVPELTANYIRQKSTECNDYTDEQVGLKQDLLVPGKNIKTINGESLLGSGNIDLKIEGGSGVINDSTISSFAGFLPIGSTVIERSTDSTDGDVVCDLDNNRFVWKDLSGTFYANWPTSDSYNTTSDASAVCRSDKLFSYNGRHYMVINGTLQDISKIETVLRAYTDDVAKFLEAKLAGFSIKFIDKCCLITSGSQPRFIIDIFDIDLIDIIKSIEVVCGGSVVKITNITSQILSTLNGNLLLEGVNEYRVNVSFADELNFPTVTALRGVVCAVPPAYVQGTIIHPDGPTSPFNLVGIPSDSSLVVKIPKSLIVPKYNQDLFLNFRFLQLTCDGAIMPLTSVGEETVNGFQYIVYETPIFGDIDSLYNLIMWFKS